MPLPPGCTRTLPDNLLSGAGRVDDEAGGKFLLAVGSFLSVDQVEAAFDGGRGFGERGGEGAEGAADFLILLQNHWGAVIDGRGDGLECVGDFPEDFAAGGAFDVFVGEAGNFFVAVEHDAEAVAAGAFFEEVMNAAGAPQGDDVGLGDDEDRVGEVGEQAGGGIEATGSVDHDVAIMVGEKVEEAGEFGRCGHRGVGLAGTGEKMQPVLRGRHEAFEQRSVEAMEVFQSVRHAEAGAEIEMKLGVADGSEVDQDNAVVSLLESDGSVDRGGGGAGAALGTEEGENPGFAGAAASPRAVGTEAGEGFEQGFGAGRIIEKLSGAGAHGGHNAGWLPHGAVGKNGQLQRVRLDQFDGADGGLRILRRNIDDHHFGPEILNLAQDGVCGAGGKADVGVYGAGQAGGFQAALEFR